MEAEVLSRIQMAFTLSFHIIFPTLTIGLACYIALMETCWYVSSKSRFRAQADFWLKPFALTFGMGVVTGVVLSYEFGANFSEFSNVAGPVIGPLMAYEVMTAFFLEAGFLGIMLFGRNRVSKKIYLASCITVSVGTLISAFWIIAANSWMQTPAGAVLVDGQYQVESWFEVIFNPSFGYRLVHMLLASFVTTGFVIAGVGAALLLRDKSNTVAKFCLSKAALALVVLTPLQIAVGDMHGLNVLAHQPAKVAAMEGIWETEQGAGLRLLAWPNQTAGKNDWEIKIPHAASLILTHELDGEVVGLNDFGKENIPNVAFVFFSFRVMLGIGVLMLLTAIVAAWRVRKGTVDQGVYWLRWLKYMIPSGFIATLAGWYVAEVGRQPWVVYNAIRTVDVASPLSASKLYLSLTLFVICYSLLFVVYLYFMRKTLLRGDRHNPPQMAQLDSHNMVKEVHHA